MAILVARKPQAVDVRVELRTRQIVGQPFTQCGQFTIGVGKAKHEPHQALSLVQRDLAARLWLRITLAVSDAPAHCCSSRSNAAMWRSATPPSRNSTACHAIEPMPSSLSRERRNVMSCTATG